MKILPYASELSWQVLNDAGDTVRFIDKFGSSSIYRVSDLSFRRVHYIYNADWLDVLAWLSKELEG